MFNLPVELLIKIFFYLSPREAIKICLTSKDFFQFLDPSNKTGVWMWKKYRESLMFPDPNMINLTDFMFLKAYYTTGCNFCTKHPRIKKVTWQFFGKKFCDECLSRLTIRSYLLETDYISKDLPSIERIGYSKYHGETYYFLYFLEDINKIYDEHYVQERINTNHHLVVFLKDLDLAEKRLKKKQLYEKKKKIDLFIKKEFPSENFDLITKLKEYETALQSKSDFSSRRSKSILKNSLRKKLNIYKVQDVTLCKFREELTKRGYDEQGINFCIEQEDFKNMLRNIRYELSNSYFQYVLRDFIYILNKRRYQDDFRSHIIIYVLSKNSSVKTKDILDNKIFKHHYNSVYEYYTEQKLEKIGEKIFTALTS